MSQSPDRGPHDPVDAARPTRGGRRRGRLIPIAIVLVILLIFAYIILVSTSR
jgi:hypothetical protein